jgi:hypothetical protein
VPGIAELADFTAELDRVPPLLPTSRLACPQRTWRGRPLPTRWNGSTSDRPTCSPSAGSLDRLSRSVRDFTTVLERAKRRGWSVVCCDLGVDTTSPSGEFMANVIASASQ